MSSRYSGYGQTSRLLFAHFPLKNNKSIILYPLYERVQFKTVLAFSIGTHIVVHIIIYFITGSSVHR